MEAKLVFLEHQLKSLITGVKVKDLSLAASLRGWNGGSKPKLVTEFLTQTEQSAKASFSSDDIMSIVKAKLTGEVLQFVNGTEPNISHEILKSILLERFSDKLPAVYNCDNDYNNNYYSTQ
jgi:hypothetical protein